MQNKLLLSPLSMGRKKVLESVKLDNGDKSLEGSPSPTVHEVTFSAHPVSQSLEDVNRFWRSELELT